MKAETGQSVHLKIRWCQVKIQKCKEDLQLMSPELFGSFNGHGHAFQVPGHMLNYLVHS